MNSGLISKTLDWITHPSKSEGTPMEWAAGLVIVLILSFLWTTVISQIE
jgi:hypothetical protein